MKCGHCQQTEGVTVEHVRNCAAPKQAQDFKPMALATPTKAVPASKYAIVIADELQFFSVKAGTKNPSVRFVDRLIGHPGDWQRLKLSREQQKAVLDLIRNDVYLDRYNGGEDTDGEIIERELLGPEAAAVRFSREFTCCSRCQSPLSDPVSRQRGLGRDCYGYFAAVA